MELEKRYIKWALEKTQNHKDKAASLLGICRRTLYRKEREYGFESEAQVDEEDKDWVKSSFEGDSIAGGGLR